MTTLRLTPADRIALQAVVEQGTIKEAAYAIGSKPNALDKRMTRIRVRNRLGSTFAVVYLFGCESREREPVP